MNDAFTALSPAERRAFQQEFFAGLQRRDGELDRARRHLGGREPLLREIEASAPADPPVVDQAVFDRNQARATPEEGLDRATLWALVAAKVNRGENYGVVLALDRTAMTGEEVNVRIAVQEVYHTRILRQLVRALGVRMEMTPPPSRLRALIATMALAPHAIAGPLVLAGEVVGVALFRLLLSTARELFAARPDVLRKVVPLLEMILEDELGHVRFARATLGPTRLWLARRALGTVTRSLLRQTPELVRLFGQERIEAELATVAARP